MILQTFRTHGPGMVKTFLLPEYTVKSGLTRAGGARAAKHIKVASIGGEIERNCDD